MWSCRWDYCTFKKITASLLRTVVLSSIWASKLCASLSPFRALLHILTFFQVFKVERRLCGPCPVCFHCDNYTERFYLFIYSFYLLFYYYYYFTTTTPRTTVYLVFITLLIHPSVSVYTMHTRGLCTHTSVSEMKQLAPKLSLPVYSSVPEWKENMSQNLSRVTHDKPQSPSLPPGVAWGTGNGDGVIWVHHQRQSRVTQSDIKQTLHVARGCWFVRNGWPYIGRCTVQLAQTQTTLMVLRKISGSD